jgi:hypothetical protein
MSSFNDPNTPYTPPLRKPTWPTPPGRGAQAAGQAPRRGWLGCGIALGLVAAFALGVIVTALAFSAFFLSAPAPVSSSNTSGAALTVTVTDKLLSEEARANSAGLLAQPQIHISSDGSVTASGVLQGTPVGAGQTAVVVLAPRAEQGKITVTAVSGSVAGFPLPSIVLTPISSQMTSALAQASSISLSAQNLTVQGINFANGQMTIAYA